MRISRNIVGPFALTFVLVVALMGCRPEPAPVEPPAGEKTPEGTQETSPPVVEVSASSETPAAAAVQMRLRLEDRAALHTSPTLAQPGDLIAVSVVDPDRATSYGLAYPVKYVVENLAGERIAALSSRTNAEAFLHTRLWPEGGYRLTAEIDPPGSGTIPLWGHFYVGDYEAAVDRFLREAELDHPPGSRSAMTLDYCVDRVRALRDAGEDSLREASREVIDYLGWLQEFRAAGGSTDDLFGDRIGSHVRGYRSAIDDSVQHYALYVPENYYRGEPIPLIVVLHGYDPDNRPYAAWNRQVRDRLRRLARDHRVIVLQPHGRGNTFYRGIGCDDVLRAVDEVTRDYDVDPDRVCLMGYSMGGSGTWAVGTFYADRFAAIAPVFGGPPYRLPSEPADSPRINRRFRPYRVSPFDCLENLLHTPVFINHGDADQLVPVDYSRQATALLQRMGYDVRYWEHPGKGHGGLPIEDTLFDWFDGQERPAAPRHVRFRAAWLRHGSMHWVEIEQFENVADSATVDARILPDNMIAVETQNVGVLSLTPGKDLIDPERPLDVVWNGREAIVDRVADRRWRMVSPSAPPDALTASLRKTADFEGPMRAVCQAPFLIVQGTQAPDPVLREVVAAEAQSLVARWEQWQHVTPRVKLDADVTFEEMQRYNLVVVGGPDENFIAAKLLAELPVGMGEGQVDFFGRTFKGEDLGLVFCFPNPLGPDRCVKFLLAASPAGMQGLDARSVDIYDFFVSDDRTLGGPDAEATMVAAGRFDPQWQFQDDLVETGDKKKRDAIKVPRKGPSVSSVADAPDVLYLSDLVPVERVGAYRDVAIDRTPWGESLVPVIGLEAGREGGKGIASDVPHGLNRIAWDLNGACSDFYAEVALQRPHGVELSEEEKKNTRVMFRVTGDGETLWESPEVGWDSEPVEVEVDVEGVTRLGLEVSNAVHWHYRTDSANWSGARVER